MQIKIGESNSKEIELDQSGLRKHLFICGATGSGKTRLAKKVIEEINSKDIPCIIVDPQGDWASFLNQFNIKRLWALGLKTADMISLLPDLNFSKKDEDSDLLINLASSNIAALCGYDLRKDKGKAAVAAITSILEDKHDLYGSCALNNLAEEINCSAFVDEIIKKSERLDLVLKLRRQNIGLVGKLLYDGSPIGKELKKSIDNQSVVVYDVSRLSGQEQAFAVSVLVSELFRICKEQSSKLSVDQLQAMLVIDEAFHFAPPVRITACKDVIRTILKQGRKYGLGATIISQSPGDIDYKVVGQANSFFIGKLTTPIELEKIRPKLSSIQANFDRILKLVPSLTYGKFIYAGQGKDELFNMFEPEGNHRILSEDEVKELVQEYSLEKCSSVLQPEPLPIEPQVYNIVNNIIEDNTSPKPQEKALKEAELTTLPNTTNTLYLTSQADPVPDPPEPKLVMPLLVTAPQAVELALKSKYWIMSSMVAFSKDERQQPKLRYLRLWQVTFNTDKRQEVFNHIFMTDDGEVIRGIPKLFDKSIIKKIVAEVPYKTDISVYTKSHDDICGTHGWENDTDLKWEVVLDDDYSEDKELEIEGEAYKLFGLQPVEETRSIYLPYWRVIVENNIIEICGTYPCLMEI